MYVRGMDSFISLFQVRGFSSSLNWCLVFWWIDIERRFSYLGSGDMVLLITKLCSSLLRKERREQAGVDLDAERSRHRIQPLPPLHVDHPYSPRHAQSHSLFLQDHY